jgi:hypothetical protein
VDPKIVTLSERIKARKPVRQPEWIRRMQEGKLPNKDMTGKVVDHA